MSCALLKDSCPHSSSTKRSTLIAVTKSDTGNHGRECRGITFFYQQKNKNTVRSPPVLESLFNQIQKRAPQSAEYGCFIPMGFVLLDTCQCFSCFPFLNQKGLLLLTSSPLVFQGNFGTLLIFDLAKTMSSGNNYLWNEHKEHLARSL